jgi:mannosyl-3-phosphoglycerate phosphatase
MKVRVIFTDLDGTLLELNGTICQEALDALAQLSQIGVPVCPLTSKTAAELASIMDMLGLATPAGFENGAGVLLSDGTLELQPSAVPVAELVALLARARGETGAPVRTILELADGELSALTGLRGEALSAARARQATLPLLVERSWDERLRAALGPSGRLRLIRGNKFLHLQGDHDKVSVLPRLVQLLGQGTGVTVACGDSPNDAELLAHADVQVIVPGAGGPNPDLVRGSPHARVAPLPHGRGWAASVRAIVSEAEAWGPRATQNGG